MAGFIGSLLASFGLRSSASSQPALPKSTPAGFPYPVHWVAGSAALAKWENLRRMGDGWPIVVGDQKALSLIAEGVLSDDRQEPHEILKAAAVLHHPQSLTDYRRREAEKYSLAGSQETEEDTGPEVGAWPSATPEPSPGLATAEDILTGKPLDRVAIVVLPTTSGWEVPAYLNWGGWNENPPPEIHVAALRSWHEKYGATLIGVSGDVMNLRVSRRPASREEALELARQHYQYCSDIVDQGVGTLAKLAAVYLNDDWWFFWWD